MKKQGLECFLLFADTKKKQTGRNFTKIIFLFTIAWLLAAKNSNSLFNDIKAINDLTHKARTYLQLPLQQWSAGNVYLLVLSSWEVNIAKNPIAVMGL